MLGIGESEEKRDALSLLFSKVQRRGNEIQMQKMRFCIKVTKDSLPLMPDENAFYHYCCKREIHLGILPV